jgi:hypothetical protein
MSKRNKTFRKDVINDIETEIIDDLEFKELEYIEERCNVLWKHEHNFAFDFKGYGVSVHVNKEHVLDIEKIKDIIKIKYLGEIGTPNFQYFVIYE